MKTILITGANNGIGLAMTKTLLANNDSGTHYAEAGAGVIHNLCSGVAYTGISGMMIYTSSKGAIESLTRTLALEYAPRGITFTVNKASILNASKFNPRFDIWISCYGIGKLFGVKNTA